MDHWMLVGPPDNWRESASLGHWWGVPDSRRTGAAWRRLPIGDTLLFYATRPISRLIGYGILEDKMVGVEPLFRAEKQVGDVLWPLRLSYSPTAMLPADKWESHGLRVERRGLVLNLSLQRLREARANELITALVQCI